MKTIDVSECAKRFFPHLLESHAKDLITELVSIDNQRQAEKLALHLGRKNPSTKRK